MPVVLVHCVPRLLLDDPATSHEQREQVDQVLRDAVGLAAHAPAVEATIRRVEPLGLDVGRSIVEAAGAEDLLVVGARGHSLLGGVLLGSVSQYAVRHAAGPVVVVRRARDLAATRTLVGFDESPGAHLALDWAMSRTASTGGEVTALRSWRAAALSGAGNVLPLPEDASLVQERERQRLEADLEPWRGKYPGVRLLAEAVPGHPGHLLTVASQHGALLVVGSRGRGTLTDTLLGSVSQAVLHHAQCPVAVVR
jgi:nucleotide-binding universal stress UspA family protein